MPLRKFSLLCGLVLVLVALGMLVALLAMFISVDIGGDVPTAVITSRLPLPPLLTDAEKAKAVQIIREADVVNTITGDQEWEVAGIVETYIAGSAKAASTKIFVVRTGRKHWTLAPGQMLGNKASPGQTAIEQRQTPSG